MESLEVMENGVRSCNGGVESLEVMCDGVELCNGRMEQLSNGVKESDHLDVDILEDLESYMQDVNDRLTISRMVSDSVIKGMVTAVTEEAAEEIAQKEREVTKLKEMLHVHPVAVDENELSGSSVMLRESTGIQHGLARIGSRDGIQQPSSREAFAGHDRIAETLVHLRGTTNEEFKKLRKEIDSIRRHGLMKRISSGSGLGDILQDKVSDRWDVERTLDSLKTTIESVYQQVEEMIHFSKASVYEWQLEQEFKAKIEAFVTGNCIWTVRGNMRDCFCDVKNLNWDGKMKEISDIRDELSAISKSLTVSDNGQLSSHESLGGEEESSSGKKGAASHHKVLNYLKSASSLPSTITTAAATISPSASSLWEENGIHDEIEINMEEHLDPVLLKHMNKEELISHCKNEITKLKRNHELKIQDLTEQHFSHRRELLRERGPSLILKKNKEFEMLGKRISEVISKVDEILVEKEEVDTLLTHTFGSNEESLSSLKDKVESLLSENHQLRDLLEDKKREIKCLSLQISEASENLSQRTLAEAKLLETVGNLKAAMEDAQIEALIGEGIFANIVREVVDEIKCIAKESQVENSVVHDAEPSTKCELEDLNMESAIMQELCDIVFKDALKDAEKKLNELNIKYIDEYELRVLHEMEKRDKEKQLKVEVANKERLRQEVLILVKEKEQLAQDAAAALAKEKERYEITEKKELCDIVFKDALKDAEKKLNELNIKYIDEYELRVLHEMEKRDKEKQLKVEVANKERLRQEVLILVKEKEQLAQDAAAALAKEKERYEITAQEVENLRGETCQHQKSISESLEVSKAAKRDLVEALKQSDRHKADIFKLEQKLEVAVQELRQVEEDRRMLLDVNQEKQVAVSLLEAKKRELSEQFESIAVYVSGLLKSFNDFECRVTQEISGRCSRLKSLTSQSHVLQQKADVLVRRGLLYKQRFEKKCADLEKAEAEVDLLGDEVETLLNLVEKLYIGLDHYSPILQHYPGITEILKLLKRELSPEN